MPTSMAKTPINLSSQLQQWLEGEAILVGDIPKMDTPPKYFSNGNLVQSLSEATEECHPLDISFWYGVDFFLH
jgi:hypothetical protein